MNEEILGALKSALTRGESLKRAMMTLYNAGYSKEEISEAARSVNMAEIQVQQPQQNQQPLQQNQQQNISQQTYQPQQLAQQPMQTQQLMQQGMQTQQRVSNYNQPPKPGSKTIIILLGFLLLILVGILATIFLFKNELLNFFNNLFS